MLEHSRTSTGERTLTDLNTLSDEYLRLSFHGMKAKNKDFQADFELIIDKNLPPIKAVPQDIGRVLLNIINNAFQSPLPAGSTAVKKVTVQTFAYEAGDKAPRGGVGIRIADNGNGMSEAVKAKIFQPFFTTKPTGEGTGLGLSLSYDIITKGHGGTIEVASKEGEGATFVVRLPL
jgi:two-component system, NtrC family, sensor kinase